MKAVGIVGYKKSGKTALVMRLCRELKGRGKRVAVIKHVSHHLDFADTDTARLRSCADMVSAISSEETEIILRGDRRLEDVLPYAQADILLMEGFKGEKTFPKIACVRDPGEAGGLLGDLGLFTAGLDRGTADFHILDDDHIGKMADRVVARGFKLPGLDCGRCGHASCFDLARAMVKGEEKGEACLFLGQAVSIRVDGIPLPLNPYLSGLFRDTFLAMLSSLKGFRQGSVVIEIP